MRVAILFLAQLSAQRCGSEFVVTVLGMERRATNTQIVVHVLVPETAILNHGTRKLQRQHSQLLKYSSKGDREAIVVTLPLYITISNCQTAFFGGIIKIIQAQCVLPLARDQEMEE